MTVSKFCFATVREMTEGVKDIYKKLRSSTKIKKYYSIFRVGRDEPIIVILSKGTILSPN